MPEKARSIDPATLTTKILEEVNGSRSPRTQGVPIGQTTDGLYVVQIGSVVQVGDYLDKLVRPAGRKRPLTPRYVFGQRETFVPSYHFDDPDGDFERIKSRLRHGEELVEGMYARLTPPGQPSEIVTNRKAVWSPVALALPRGWRVSKRY